MLARFTSPSFSLSIYGEGLVVFRGAEPLNTKPRFDSLSKSMNFRLLFCLGQKAAAQLTAAGIDILVPALAQGAGDARFFQFLLKSQDLMRGDGRKD